MNIIINLEGEVCRTVSPSIILYLVIIHLINFILVEVEMGNRIYEVDVALFKTNYRIKSSISQWCAYMVPPKCNQTFCVKLNYVGFH